MSVSRATFGREALLGLVRGDLNWFERRGAMLEQDRLKWHPESLQGKGLTRLELEARRTGPQELVFPFTARELLTMAWGCTELLSRWIGDSGRTFESRLRIAQEQSPGVVPLVRAIEDLLFQDRARVILQTVREFGLDPLAVPPTHYNLGPRAEVRRHLLNNHPLFQTAAAYSHTWEKLVAQRRLVEM